MSSYPPPPPPGPQDPSGSPGPYGAPGQYGSGEPYPGQYGAGQQYPGQYGQQYPGQQDPGQYGQQQYPGQQDPGQYGQQQYPGQYGAGQYGAGQYPGYGPGAQQQYPGQYAEQYPGQYGSGSPYGQYPGAGVGTDDPLVSRSFSEWFSKVIGVVKRSWKPLAVIQLASAVLVAVATVIVVLVAGVGALAALNPTTLVQSLSSVFGAIVLAGLLIAVIAVSVYAIALGMTTHVVVRDAAGRPTSFGEAFAFARSRALPMIGWGLAVALGLGLVVLVIGGLAAATGSGTVIFLAVLLLIVAYVYVVVVFLPTFSGVVALERQGVGRMVALAHRDLAATAGRVLLFLLVAFVYNLVMGSVIDALTSNSVAVAGLLSAILISLPVGLAVSAVSIVTYAGLRHHENPAVGTQTLAAEMQR